MKKVCEGCQKGSDAQLGRVLRRSHGDAAISGYYHESCFETAVKACEASKPIDLMAWKAMRDRKTAEAVTKEDIAAYDEQLEECESFWHERSDEMFGIALRRFGLLHPADIVDDALRHMAFIALDLYRLDRTELTDSVYSAQALALLDSIRYPGARIMVVCQHGTPCDECKPCTQEARQADERRRIQIEQDIVDDDE
jgi:hypothetical protein